MAELGGEVLSGMLKGDSNANEFMMRYILPQPLPGSGLSSYRFSEFTTTKHRQVGITARGETITIGYRVFIIIETIIEEANDAFHLQKVKSILSESGGHLYVDDKTFPFQNYGSILSNASTFPVVVDNIDLENMGDSTTVKIVWSVHIDIYTLQTVNDKIAWVDVSDDYEITERGRLVRSVVWKVRGRSPFGTLNSNPSTSVIQSFFDTYNLNQLTRSSIPLAHYTWTMSVSEDRRTATIKRVENQIDSDTVYPSGVQTINVSHRSNSNLEKDGFRRWSNEIRGEITLFPNVNKRWAWLAFSSIFRQRYERAIKTVKYTGYGNRKYDRIKWPRIISISIDEELFNLGTMSFSIKYDQFVSGLTEVFERTGLLTKITVDNTDVQWSASTGRPQINHPTVVYGHTNVKVNNYALRAGSLEESPYGDPFSFYSIYSPQGTSVTQTTCPPENDSWKEYQNQFTFINSRSMARHEKYVDLQPSTTSQSYGDRYRYGINSDSQIETVPTDSHQTYQVTGPGMQMLEMRGFALRYGGPTPAPTPNTHAGKIIKLANEVVKDRIISSTECPLHFTTWVKRYYILGTVQPQQEQTALIDPQMDSGPFQYS